MPYGIIKIDTITFTDAGVDKSVSISGLVQNPTFTGNVTATGTISGLIVQAPTVTGTTANFASGVYTTQISGAIVKVPAGSAGAPSIQVGVGASVAPGLYGAGTDLLGISTGGAGRIFIDSTGQLGVGTSSPQNALVVSNGGAEGLEFVPSASGSPTLIAFNRGTASYAPLTLNGSQQIFQTSGTERLRIDSSGRVGIGTSSPSTLLHLAAASGDVQIQFNSGGTSSYIGHDSAFTGLDIAGGGGIKFRYFNGASFAEAARIDSSGRLLVGTSSTASAGGSQYAKLQVKGNTFSDSGGGVISVLSGTTTPASGVSVGAVLFAGTTGNEFGRIECIADAATGASDYPGRLVFSTTADGASSPTERMRISNAGDMFMADGRYIYVNGNGDSPRGGLVCTNTSNNTNATVITFKGWDNSTTGSISTRVNVTTYSTSSDYRLKENIVGLSDAIARLQLLKPKRFNFKANPEETIDGFLAHEAQLAVPEAVTGTKDQEDDEGNPIYQGIDLGKLVPLLTASLQEAIGRIEALEAEVADLKTA
jgi:hypothetical protein